MKNVKFQSTETTPYTSDKFRDALAGVKDEVIDNLSITINWTMAGYEIGSYSAEHHQSLLLWLRERQQPITGLNLYGNALNDEQVQEIIKEINANPKLGLKALSLNHNDFGVSTLKYILNGLKDKSINYLIGGFEGYDNGRYGNSKLETDDAGELMIQIMEVSAPRVLGEATNRNRFMSAPSAKSVDNETIVKTQVYYGRFEI